MSAELALPDPQGRIPPVPPGWFEHIAAPAILEATNWAWLDEIEARLLALASYVESFDPDEVEYQKALRVVEKRRADLLPSHQGYRSDLLPACSPEVDASERTVSRWRKIQRWWDVLWPFLLEPRKRNEVSQAALLRLAELEEAKKEQADRVPVGQSRIALESFESWLPQQEACDLLFTDPPYSTDMHDIRAFVASWLPLALEKVKPTGNALVFVGAYPIELHAYFSVAMPTQVLVWQHPNTLGQTPHDKFNLDYQAVLYYRGSEAPSLNITETKWTRTVQRINAPDGRQADRFHRWQKPLELAEAWIRLLTKQGDLVLDPFAGSGSLLLAAAAVGCLARGCDIDPQAVAIAKERGLIEKARELAA